MSPTDVDSIDKSGGDGAHNEAVDLEAGVESLDQAELHPLEAQEIPLEEDIVVNLDVDVPDLEAGNKVSSVDGSKEETKVSTVHDDASIVFPAPFYCPLTKKLLEDPVVAPDGISYERQAILETEKYTEEQLYPNRGLSQIMEEVMQLAGDSMDAKVRQFQKTMKDGISQLLEKSVLPTDEFRPLPDAFYCPITFDLIHVPVIDPEGNTFEHVAVANWIHVNSSSPITRNKLCMEDLVPNKAIQDLLELEKSKPEDQMHPNVRKFKNEPAPIMPEFPDPNETSGPDGTRLPSRLGHPSLTFLFPTTMEELEYRRQARRKIVCCSVLGVICLIMALVAAIMYGGSCIFVSIWLSCCLKDSLRRLREIRMEEDAFTELHQEEQRARESQRQAWQEQQEREERMEEEAQDRLQEEEEEQDIVVSGGSDQSRTANTVEHESTETRLSSTVERIANTEETSP